jgi:hypothetical protein
VKASEPQTINQPAPKPSPSHQGTRSLTRVTSRRARTSARGTRVGATLANRASVSAAPVERRRRVKRVDASDRVERALGAVMTATAGEPQRRRRAAPRRRSPERLGPPKLTSYGSPPPCTGLAVRIFPLVVLKINPVEVFSSKINPVEVFSRRLADEQPRGSVTVEAFGSSTRRTR